MYEKNLILSAKLETSENDFLHIYRTQHSQIICRSHETFQTKADNEITLGK
jgi:hypothetical protein